MAVARRRSRRPHRDHRHGRALPGRARPRHVLVQPAQRRRVDAVLLRGRAARRRREPRQHPRSRLRAAPPRRSTTSTSSTPRFFGMSPRDAAVFDPQHRLFLECAWEAFEHAGYVGERIDGAVGVFASCGLSEYMFKNVLANEHVADVGRRVAGPPHRQRHQLPGHPRVLRARPARPEPQRADRVQLDARRRAPRLPEPAQRRVRHGARRRRRRRAGAAPRLLLQGGRDPLARRALPGVRRQVGRHDHLQRLSAPSLLKPLGDAIDDGDNVLAVIRGSAINNDGRAKVGYLAPSVAGQAQVVTEALAVAGVDARDVTYVEAHGTGTLIGDPIEIAGLTQAYRLGTDDTAVLRDRLAEVEHRPHRRGGRRRRADQDRARRCSTARSRRACTSSRPTRRPTSRTARSSSTPSCGRGSRAPAGTRIAGITGLGAGGTNAHVIVEEAPDGRAVRARRGRPS